MQTCVKDSIGQVVLLIKAFRAFLPVECVSSSALSTPFCVHNFSWHRTFPSNNEVSEKFYMGPATNILFKTAKPWDMLN